ncbi:MAG: DUF2927 domain-containing protein [Roseobacter sp.]
MRRWIALSGVLVLTACAAPTRDTASRTMIAETTLPPMKMFTARAPEAPVPSNRALVRDFLDLSFALESGKALPVFTRFEGPISLRVTGRSTLTLMPDLNALLGRLRTEAGIDVSLTEQADASITIEAVPRAMIRKTLPQAACFVAPNVSSMAEFRKNRRNPRSNWATLKTRQQLVIVVPSDVSPQEIRDCLHEELAQALGPLNDLYRLPNTVFNDDNVHTVLTRFDMLILRATYAPELASGMTRGDVESRLPAIFARINPDGRSIAAPKVTPTPQSYVRAIQRALGPDASRSTRVAAADDALRIAIEEGWQDGRRGFAHYAKGRALQAEDPVAAYAQFTQARAVYARSPATRLHRAHISTQLAAFALASGDPALARALVTPHIAVARDAQNAALLTTLQLIEAEALEAENRLSQASILRLDSLGWARYGFGADWAVELKLREISALNPSAPPV